MAKEPNQKGRNRDEAAPELAEFMFRRPLKT